MQQEKISRADRSWTNTLNVLQEAIHHSLIKFCIYCFSFWYEFFVKYAWGVEKMNQHDLDEGPLEFQFLRPTGCLTNPFRTLSLCFGVIGKIPPVIILLKKLSQSIIAIMSWQDVTRSSLCSGVKERGTKRAHNFLFPKSSFRILRTSLRDVQKFCYNS